MKLANFRLTKTKGNTILNREYFADVDVTTGALWWKRTERKQIRREYAGFWHFVESGELIPIGKVGNLARAWKAQTGEDC